MPESATPSASACLLQLSVVETIRQGRTAPCRRGQERVDVLVLTCVTRFEVPHQGAERPRQRPVRVLVSERDRTCGTAVAGPATQSLLGGVRRPDQRGLGEPPGAVRGPRHDGDMGRWSRREPVRQRTRIGGFPVEGGSAYLAVAQGRLDLQMTQVDALDSKAVGVLQMSVAEAGLLVALLAILAGAQNPTSGGAWTALAVTAALTTAVVWLGTRALLVREWSSYPTPNDAWTAANGPKPTDWDLARTLEDAYTANKPHVDGKVDDVQRSALVLGAQTVGMIVSALLLVYT